MTWSPREPDRVTTCTPLDTRGPKRLWDLPAGVVTRERGDLERIVEREYLCPVHGRFEARVPRGNIPDDMPCPHDEGDLPFFDPLYVPGASERPSIVTVRSCIMGEPAGDRTIGGSSSWPTEGQAMEAIVEAGLDVDDFAISRQRVNHCGRTSPWSPSTVATWKSAGEIEG